MEKAFGFSKQKDKNCTDCQKIPVLSKCWRIRDGLIKEQNYQSQIHCTLAVNELCHARMYLFCMYLPVSWVVGPENAIVSFQTLYWPQSPLLVWEKIREIISQNNWFTWHIRGWCQGRAFLDSKHNAPLGEHLVLSRSRALPT